MKPSHSRTALFSRGNCKRETTSLQTSGTKSLQLRSSLREWTLWQSFRRSSQFNKRICEQQDVPLEVPSKINLSFYVE